MKKIVGFLSTVQIEEQKKKNKKEVHEESQAQSDYMSAGIRAGVIKMMSSH